MECARRNPVVNHDLVPLLVLPLNHPLNADPDALANLCLLLRKHASTDFARMDYARRNPVVNHYLDLAPLLVLPLNHLLNADPDALVNPCLLLRNHANEVFVRMDYARRNPVVNRYLDLAPLLVLPLNHPLNADPDALVNQDLLLRNHANEVFVRMECARRNPVVNRYLDLAPLLNHPLNADPDALVNINLLT
jgi:hypothetical protein